MILFDKSKLIKFSGGKYNNMIDILAHITYRFPPKSPGDVRRLKYQTISWGGDSFLLNPEKLLDNHFRYRKKEVMQYILVAAKRSYPEYKLFRKKTLSAHLLNADALVDNRLLTITGNEIHLKFEEASNGY